MQSAVYRWHQGVPNGLQTCRWSNSFPTDEAWIEIIPDGDAKKDGNMLNAMCPFTVQSVPITCKGISIDRHRVMHIILSAVCGELHNMTPMFAHPYTLLPTFEMEYQDQRVQELINNIGPDQTEMWVGIEHSVHLHAGLLPERARAGRPDWNEGVLGHRVTRLEQMDARVLPNKFWV